MKTNENQKEHSHKHRLAKGGVIQVCLYRNQNGCDFVFVTVTLGKSTLFSLK